MEGRHRPVASTELLEEMRLKQANQKWLDDHRDELRKKYADHYVAVLDGGVVGESEDFRKLVSKLRKELQERPLSVAVIEFISQDELVWVL